METQIGIQCEKTKEVFRKSGLKFCGGFCKYLKKMEKYQLKFILGKARLFCEAAKVIEKFSILIKLTGFQKKTIFKVIH
jgi:hypothetical protein